MLYTPLVLYFSIGKAVSKKEREELNLKDSTLVYGEITFDMLGTVLEKIKKVYGKSNVGASGASGCVLIIINCIYNNIELCYNCRYYPNKRWSFL